MKSILEILTLSTEFLKQKGIENPRRQAEEVISDALEVPRMQLYVEFDRPLGEAELDLCRKRLARRGKGEPAAYIRGEVDFHDCLIKVTPDVLIPRQETGILVEKIITQLSKENIVGKKLWDVCCGSGCIGIALKKRFPQLDVTLVDISAKAVELATENAHKNGIEAKILLGDLLTPLAGQKTDYFVCNPPYVSEQEYRELDREVKEFEPSLALLGGKSGLEFYERLALELPPFLNPSGRGWLEIGHQQAQGVLTLFNRPPYGNCRIEKDWAGQDRFFLFEYDKAIFVITS